ncbi:MAG: Lrp/AsnC family transcriptional regulator [Thermodesulfobacteriota bacterium]|nr:Lrp/AsnC family transcriptional regulator [Thermodesulfobacteriota bacterium]
MLKDDEKKIIAAIQGDIPVTSRPYKAIAEEIGLSEESVISTLQSLCERGVIRRFGATLRHQRSGIRANAMVAWSIPEDRIAEVGQRFAGFKAVSHCYRRDPAPTWPFNLYTMVHATDEAGCRDTTREMATAVGVEDYKVLFSRRELKKTSMVYFNDEDD